MAPLPAPLLVEALLAASDDGVVAWDQRGDILLWSRRTEGIFGCADAVAVGQPLSRFMPGVRLPTGSSRPAGPAGPAGRFEERGEPGESHFETAGLRADGERLTLAVRVSAVVAPDGEALGGVAWLRVARSGMNLPHGMPDHSADGDRLALALAAAGLGDWSWNAASDEVTLSPRAAEIFGIPAGLAVTWSTLREVLHPEDRDVVRLAVEHALSSRSKYAIEYRVLRGARERWVAASGHGRYDDGGRVLGMLGVVQEISNDRLLARLDDEVRPLVASEDITFTAARVLGQHLDVNRCAYAFVEADEDTFILTGNYTHDAPSIIGRYCFRQFGEECSRLMRAGMPYVVEDSEVDGRIADSERLIYRSTAIRSVICAPIAKSGRFVAAMAVHMRVPRAWSAREIELVQRVASRCWESIERTRMERERQELLHKAEAANRTKDEFLAILGHELRNPLAPIATALTLMRLQGDAAFERERTVIERQVTHLTRLIDDLLDVSRIARAKVVLKKEPIELALVVQRAIEVTSSLLEERAHTLQVDVPAFGLAVFADPARLTQVLSNLVSNAAKYTAPGGRIVISASAEASQVALHVADNGMGIAADALPRVFDPFVQSHQTIDRAQGGLGLGLSIVRSLVEQHGGSVSAHSPGQDQGSEFCVRLPLIEANVANVPSSVEVHAPGRPAMQGVRVLVVDDNVDAAEMLAMTLTLRGCNVLVAHDGLAALELVQQHRFDAALLDIGLPVLDGYELAERLLPLANMRGARLIAVTGYGQPADRDRALRAGFHHHLVKPVDLRLLEELVVG